MKNKLQMMLRFADASLQGPYPIMPDKVVVVLVDART